MSAIAETSSKTLITALLIAHPFLAEGQDRQDAHDAIGTWTTNWGGAEISIAGDGTLSMGYDHEGGRLLGMLRGQTLTGYWGQQSSDERCATQRDGSYYWGQVEITFTSGFERFHGTWGYCDDDPSGANDWNGRRTGGSESDRAALAGDTVAVIEVEPGGRLEAESTGVLDEVVVTPLLAAASSPAAARVNDEICVRSGDSFLGAPFSTTYVFPASEDDSAHVRIRYTMRPRFVPGSPSYITLEPSGQAQITSPEALSDGQAEQAAALVSQQSNLLRGWAPQLSEAQTEDVIGGTRLSVPLPELLPGVTREGGAPDLTMPAACASLFRSLADRTELQSQRADLLARLERDREALRQEREDAGVWGLLFDSDRANRLEDRIANNEKVLGGMDSRMAELDASIERREGTLDFEDHLREIEGIKADPERLAQEEANRLRAAIDAAREANLYKWKKIEGEKGYQEQLAGFDAMIQGAEERGITALADAMRDDRARLERARESWRESMDRIHDARLNEYQRLLDENRSDGIGPEGNLEGLLLADGQNPVEVLEGGLRERAVGAARQAEFDAASLGGETTREYTLEDFAEDLGEEHGRMAEDPALFFSRYGAYLEGAGQATLDGVVDLAVLAVEAGDTAGEWFESGLSEVSGIEFNTFGRENLDTINQVADYLSETDALEIGETARELAAVADRQLEQLAGQGEAGVETVMRGTGYVTASVFGAEEFAIAEMLKTASTTRALARAVTAGPDTTAIARTTDAGSAAGGVRAAEATPTDVVANAPEVARADETGLNVLDSQMPAELQAAEATAAALPLRTTDNATLGPVEPVSSGGEATTTLPSGAAEDVFRDAPTQVDTTTAPDAATVTLPPGASENAFRAAPTEVFAPEELARIDNQPSTPGGDVADETPTLVLDPEDATPTRRLDSTDPAASAVDPDVTPPIRAFDEQAPTIRTLDDELRDGFDDVLQGDVEAPPNVEGAGPIREFDEQAPTIRTLDDELRAALDDVDVVEGDGGPTFRDAPTQMESAAAPDPDATLPPTTSPAFRDAPTQVEGVASPDPYETIPPSTSPGFRDFPTQAEGVASPDPDATLPPTTSPAFRSAPTQAESGQLARLEVSEAARAQGVQSGERVATVDPGDATPPSRSFETAETVPPPAQASGALDVPPRDPNETLPPAYAIFPWDTPTQTVGRTTEAELQRAYLEAHDLTATRSNSELRFATDAGSADPVPLGDHIDSGSFNEVFHLAPPPEGRVVRVSRFPSDHPATKTDEFGRISAREVLDRSPRDPATGKLSFELPTRHTVHHQIISDDPRLAGKRLEIVDFAEERAGDLFAKNADGRMSDGQAAAYDRAVRALNREGYAWLDNKPDNYTFRALDGEDEWVLVILDTGGIVPARGDRPDELMETARALQQLMDDPPDDVPWRDAARNVGGYPLRWALKRDVIRRDHLPSMVDWGEEGMGLERVEDIPFLPSGAEDYPRARDLFREPFPRVD